VVACAATTPDLSPVGVAAPRASDAARLATEVVEGVNARRRSEGLAPLAADDRLALLALGHSEAMAAGRVAFGHSGVQQRLRTALGMLGGHAAAENLSSQPRRTSEVAEASIQRWWKSDAHRRNLLGSYSATGVGAARAPDGRWFVTQIFVR